MPVKKNAVWSKGRDGLIEIKNMDRAMASRHRTMVFLWPSRVEIKPDESSETK